MERLENTENERNRDAYKWDFELQEKLKNPLYCGFFVDSEELAEECAKAKIGPSLEKPVACPHITTAFRPNEEKAHLELLGEKVTVEATGYGNDGKNEGLVCVLKSDEDDVQALCDQIPVAHITLSVAKDGKPVDTAKLEFQPLAESFELTGTYGVFTKKGQVITGEETE